MKKLKKITLEYEDGSSKSMEGEDAVKWMDWVNGTCVMAELHHCNPKWEELQWKEINSKKETPY